MKSPPSPNRRKVVHLPSGRHWAFLDGLAVASGGEALACDVGLRAAVLRREALDQALEELWAWRERHRAHLEFDFEFGRVSLEITAVLERALSGGTEGCGL